jgi:hypothetical protein
MQTALVLFVSNDVHCGLGVFYPDSLSPPFIRLSALSLSVDEKLIAYGKLAR